MIRVACQTYTWEMLGASWTGAVTDLLDAVASAGYAGIEITNTMIREFHDRPAEFRGELERRGLELAAFAYATTGFTDVSKWREDLEGCRRAIEFVRGFPTPRLGLGGAAAAADHPTALAQAIRFYNEAGRMCALEGVSVNVHPHSHHGSILETARAYQELMDGLDPTLVSLGPDTGHIVRGGQDLLTCLRTHLPRITHLHLKDTTASGVWAPLGQGVCDFRGVLELLRGVHWEGWLVAEEESETARVDGVAAITANRAYLRRLGL